MKTKGMPGNSPW